METTDITNATNETNSHDLPGGTQILNISDGEPGTILNSYAGSPGAWTEYEVVTRYGIEIWKTSDFILLPAANA